MKIEDIFKRLEISSDLAKELTEGEKDINDFNEVFQGKFIARELAPNDDEIINKVTGKLFGRLTVEAQRLFDLSKVDTDNKKFEDILKMASESSINKVKELQGKITELKEDKPGDEKINSLQAELDKEKEKSSKLDGDLMSTKQKLEDEKADRVKFVKETKIETLFGGLKDKLNFADTINDMTKKGFFTTIGENFKFDLNDKNDLFVTDKNGEQVKNANETGILSPFELLEREGTKEKLLKQNNLKSDPPKSTQTEPQATGVGRRKVHADALQHEKDLEAASHK